MSVPAVRRFSRLDPETHDEEVNPDDERNRSDRDKIRPEDENQAQEGDDDDVSPQHVCEETHAESEGLREEPQNLDRYHDRPERPVYPPGQVRQVVPEPLGPDGGGLDHDKCDDGESRGDVDVPRGRGPPRDQSEQVHHEDEEKGRQEIRHVLQSRAPHVRDRDFIPEEHHDHLEEIAEPGGNGAPRILPGHGDRDDAEDDRRTQENTCLVIDMSIAIPAT